MADSLHRAFRVAGKTRENPKTISLALEGTLAASPGQFAMLWLPGVDEKPFSIAGTDPLQFVISRVGPFSEALCALKPGDMLWVRGPFGRGFSMALGQTLLVGGGYGAAPLHLLARTLLAEGVTVEVALGARTAEELLFRERFAALGVTVHAATEDGSAGARGKVTETVSPLLASGRFDRLRACGPEGMLESLAALCRRAGLPAELSYEAYMRCGIGICGACEHGVGEGGTGEGGAGEGGAGAHRAGAYDPNARGARLVCLDGPVFTI